MQVKYIVYHRRGEKLPKVDIWKTDGDILHHQYRAEHNIQPDETLSVGYLNFNPRKKTWELEHYPLQNSPSSILEAIYQAKINKRDKILVQRQIYRCDFLKDPELQMATYKENEAIKKELLLAFKSFLFRRR